jgi:8-oxo-dGTP pyrophosphatase MutT (NUDIX family)
MDSLEYPESLREYAVSEAAYLQQHPEYDCLVTGSIVFNTEGKLLLVQRAAEERAYPDFWVSQGRSCESPRTKTTQEIPGGKVDKTDQTILHAAARELKEEAGLDTTRILKKVTQFTFLDEIPGRPTTTWLKLVFEVEVQNADNVVLDPVEHQKSLYASEAEVVNDMVGDVKLTYISLANKEVKLEAFRQRREELSVCRR